jgi:hypothetical protein
MGTERGLRAPSSEDIVLHDLRRVDEEEARKRSCGQVVMVFFQRGVRRDSRDKWVWRGVMSQYACLYVCGSVMCGASVHSEAKRMSSCWVK